MNKRNGREEREEGERKTVGSEGGLLYRRHTQDQPPPNQLAPRLKKQKPSQGKKKEGTAELRAQSPNLMHQYQSAMEIISLDGVCTIQPACL